MDEYDKGWLLGVNVTIIVYMVISFFWELNPIVFAATLIAYNLLSLCSLLWNKA